MITENWRETEARQFIYLNFQTSASKASTRKNVESNQEFIKLLNGTNYTADQPGYTNVTI